MIRVEYRFSILVPSFLLWFLVLPANTQNQASLAE